MAKRKTIGLYILISLILATQWVGGCAGTPTPPPSPTPPPMGSCSLPLPAEATDEQALQAVLMAEGDLVVKQKIDELMRLWQDGSRVTDAQNTPADPADDLAWLDKDAIRHRYVGIVFPGAPKQATPADLQIQLDNSRATITATTQIGMEVSPAGDRWTLVKVGDCWQIESLTYNLEPAP